SSTALPPPSPLFPYTTLFRSQLDAEFAVVEAVRAGVGRVALLEVLAGLLLEPLALAGQVLRLLPPFLQLLLVLLDLVRPVFLRRSEEHTSELQSLTNLVCRLL